MTGRRQRRGDGVVVASLAVLVCVLGTLSGCQRAQSDADAPRQAVQGTWVLDHDVDTPEVPFVTFAADRSWVASDGCDRVYGTWRITASNRLTVVAGPQDRPIGYWVLDRSSGSPYLSLRADDSFRLSDGCTTRTGTWKFSTTDQVRLYPDETAAGPCPDGDDPDLGSSTRGRVTGNTMALTTTDGQATGTLHRFAR